MTGNPCYIHLRIKLMIFSQFSAVYVVAQMTPKTEASQGRSTASEEINPTSSTTMAMVPPSFHDNNALKIPKTVEESCMQSRKSQQESTSRTSSSSISKCFQKPLVPENRSVTHEFHASWISKVTFSWISPLMNVRLVFDERSKRE